jgi:short-subunit dehydrogenase
VSESVDRGTAVITGASSGIGAAFARKLAADGFDVVLVARRNERLEQLCDQLVAAHSIRADAHAADLADAAATEVLAERIAAIDDLALLVNNAGFGTMGYFVNVDAERQLDMIRVHVLATVRLSRAALPGMVQRGGGGIINVSSIGAWLPCAGNVQYAATKTYLNSFSVGLHDELRGTGVHVQALCPGFTYTEFHDTGEMRAFDRSDVAKFLWMSADAVVEYSLKKLAGRHTIVIPGWKNRLLARILQSRLLQSIVRAAGRYKLPDK